MDHGLSRVSGAADVFSAARLAEFIRSAGKAAVVEEGLLVRVRGAAQQRVAVREAAEAADDLGMVLGIFREFIIAIGARQLQASFLIGYILRVVEWQIEELALGM